MDGLAAGGGQTAEETAVEGGLEGEDGQLGGTGGLVVHGGLELLRSELSLGSSTLLLTVVHERGLVGSLVGIGAGHGREHLVKSLGSDLEETSVQDMSPISRGEVSQSWTVDQSRNHLGRGSDLAQVGVVVANRNGGNLSIARQHSNKRMFGFEGTTMTYTSSNTFPSRSAMLRIMLATTRTRIADQMNVLVTNRLSIISQHVQAADIKDFVQLGSGSLVLGSRNRGDHLRSAGLIGEVRLRSCSEVRGGGERAGCDREARSGVEPESRTSKGCHCEI